MTIIASLAYLAGRIAATLRQRRSVGHLRQLDDHLLADIGLSRHEIFFGTREETASP